MITCTAALSWLLHDRDGTALDASPGGAFTFYRPDGTRLPCSPALPDPEGTIGDCHDAEITPDTIVPAWYGERLDLDYAIYTSFANADYHARHPGQLDQDPLTGQRDADLVAGPPEGRLIQPGIAGAPAAPPPAPEQLMAS